MSEKRFYDVKGYIYNKKKCIGIIQDDYTCENIVNLLNNLTKENEQLKKENTNLRVELDTHKHPLWSTRQAEKIINELKEENEQLKKELDSYKPVIFESESSKDGYVTLYEKKR